MRIGWLTCIPAVLLPHSLCRFTTANAPANRQMPIASVVSGHAKKKYRLPIIINLLITKHLYRMRKRILFLLALLISTTVFNTFAQVNQDQTTQLQKLKSFTQKGTKLFVKCECWEDKQFNQDFLTELGGKGIWRIVNKADEADFILHVSAWFRPMVEMNWYDAYVLVYDNSDHLIYKSDLYTGLPTFSFAPVEDFRKATVKKLINDGLLKEIPKSKWVYSEPLDLLGYSKIPEDKYKVSEDYFRQGLDYFNQYNYKEALKIFTLALSINPYNAYIYEFKAISFYNLSKYGDAKKDIIAAMKLDPINKQNDTTYYNIMVGKNNKFMKTWGPGGTMDRINGALNAVNQTISTVNSTRMTTTSAPSNIIQSTKNTTQTITKQQMCTFCNGTGYNPAKEYPAEFGLGHSYNDTPCNICGSYTSHSHKRCPSCAGKGYKMVLTN